MVQNTNHRLEGQIFYENAGLRQITVNGRFPGGLKRAAQSRRRPTGCSPSAMRLMTNPHGSIARLCPALHLA
jgi:hypothetical protein